MTHVKDVQNHYRVIVTGSRIVGLYKLDAIKGSHQSLATSAISNVELCHQSYGHLNHNGLMLLEKNSMVNEGLLVIKDHHIECVACALGKQHRKEFPNHEEKRQTELLELIHTHVCGPIQTISLGGAWYFLIFVDDKSRLTWVYFIRRKGEVFE